MTRQGLPKVSIPIAVLLLATAALAAQSGKQENDGSATLQLPIVGTAATGRTFAGTLSIQRFEARGDKVVAIGMVTGTVAGVGTALVGPVTLPVEVGAGSQGAAAPTPQATCQVLHLNLGAVNLNLLGVQVTTLPIAIDLSGDSASPLGNLVCTIVATLNNVVGLVGLLNQLLGVVTGLVGGLIP